MLNQIKSIYLIGIGGVSMSALAQLLQKRGLIVKGSDLHLSPLTDQLAKQGIEVKEGDAPQFVKESDAVCYTAAVGDDNTDLILARKLGKKIFSRAQVLGFFSREKRTISIAGTHGKTTTTGMISTILLDGGLDPTIHIGGQLKAIKSNLHIGEGEYFVTEACEYKDAYLGLTNYISVILNVEEDHLDYFKNYENILASFNKFAQNTVENGIIVYNYDACEGKIQNFGRKVVTFGFNDGADLQAINIEERAGQFSFEGKLKGKSLGRFSLPCFGRHNIYNALASIAVCLSLGVGIDDIRRGLENFQGVGRRMEVLQKEPSLIIHDYAHHPQEIEASLKAIRSMKDNRLICIFQPHTFTRTQALWQEFLKCFSCADQVWMLPIYPAREKPIKGITSFQFCKDLRKNGKKTRYFSSFDACFDKIMSQKDNGYTFAVLGAGDIEILANMLK